MKNDKEADKVMDTFYGWTLKQWAIAIGYEDTPPKSLAEALKLREEWRLKNRGDAPPENLSIILVDGDPRTCDYETAYKVF